MPVKSLINSPKNEKIMFSQQTGLFIDLGLLYKEFIVVYWTVNKKKQGTHWI